MDDPLACITGIYAHFNMPFTTDARQRMQEYLVNKPRGKFGRHDYAIDERKAKDRPMFRRYQDLYNVPDEV